MGIFIVFFVQKSNPEVKLGEAFFCERFSVYRGWDVLCAVGSGVWCLLGLGSFCPFPFFEIGCALSINP